LAALIALVAVVVGTTVIVANRDASAPRAVAAAQPSTGQAPVRLSGDTRQVRVNVRQEAALVAKTCVEAIPDEGVGISRCTGDNAAGVEETITFFNVADAPGQIRINATEAGFDFLSTIRDFTLESGDVDFCVKITGSIFGISAENC
jgi:hypothetical protein